MCVRMCMYMYVMYACMEACMYVMYACVYVCFYTCKCVCMYLRMCVHIHKTAHSVKQLECHCRYVKLSSLISRPVLCVYQQAQVACFYVLLYLISLDRRVPIIFEIVSSWEAWYLE